MYIPTFMNVLKILLRSHTSVSLNTHSNFIKYKLHIIKIIDIYHIKFNYKIYHFKNSKGKFFSLRLVLVYKSLFENVA